jgi:cytochrome oxidase Cu insertion factor (SCO1/SenC/PrrC family)
MKKPLAILLLLFSFASAQSKPDTVNYNDITIKLGSIVPNFSVQDETGMTRQWINLNGKKNLVLIFYRGYW